MEVSSSTIKAVVEPLIDLIHGDVALGDACCQRIGGAFVMAHQSRLRQLLVDTALLPAGLVKALEVYCVRSYLVDAPQLLTESAEVGAMLGQLATSLIVAAHEEHAAAASQEGGEERPSQQPQPQPQPPRHNGHPHRHERDAEAAEFTGPEEIRDEDAALAAKLLASSGERIQAWAATLRLQQQQGQPVASQFRADLVEALGEVVLAYVVRAAQQCAQQARAYLDGGSWRSTQVAHTAFRATLCRFVRSAVESRAARERERAAAEEAEVQALIFGGDAASAAAVMVVDSADTGDGAEDAVESAARRLQQQQQQQAAVAGPSTQDDFAAAVRAAMESASPSPAPPLTSQPLLQHPVPPRRAGRKRELRAVNDSVDEQCDALVHAVTPTPPPQQQEEEDRRVGQSAAGALLGESTVSPELVQDPSLLSFAASVERSPNQRGSTDEDGAAPPKRSRTAPVLIGASETSVLRLMAGTTTHGGDDVNLPTAVESVTRPSALTPSSTLPFGAQATHAQESGAPAESAGASAVAAAVDEGLQRCVQGDVAEARSYFLCAATQRFEPCVARGLL